VGEGDSNLALVRYSRYPKSGSGGAALRRTHLIFSLPLPLLLRRASSLAGRPTAPIPSIPTRHKGKGDRDGGISSKGTPQVDDSLACYVGNVLFCMPTTRRRSQPAVLSGLAASTRHHQLPVATCSHSPAHITGSLNFVILVVQCCLLRSVYIKL
jgi:hypothetical protein